MFEIFSIPIGNRGRFHCKLEGGLPCFPFLDELSLDDRADARSNEMGSLLLSQSEHFPVAILPGLDQLVPKEDLVLDLGKTVGGAIHDVDCEVAKVQECESSLVYSELNQGVDT